MKIIMPLSIALLLVLTAFFAMETMFYKGDVVKLQQQVVELQQKIATKPEPSIKPQPIKPGNKVITQKRKSKTSKKTPRRRKGNGTSENGTDQWGWCRDRTRC